jgi:6-phosphogluconolactonase
MQCFMVYVGTYTHTDSVIRAEGIFIYRLEPGMGTLTFVGTVAGIMNPSFLSISADSRFLYAVNELAEFNGQPGGGISGFAIDSQSGLLTLLNTQSTGGAAPCHVSIDEEARLALVANYYGGSIAVFPIARDGHLGDAIQIIHHHGSSVNVLRQEAPHVHSILLDRAAHYALVADLGMDKIVIYRIDRANPTKPLLKEHEVTVDPGSGPRHMVFHPTGHLLYLANELSSTVTVYAYNENDGTLCALQSVSTLPEGFVGTNFCADIHVAPSGMYLYVSNRGHDSITVFAIDQATGYLTLVEFVPTRGKTPRNFVLDPTGPWLLVANQDSDNLVQFRVDKASGKLIATGQAFVVPNPVCVKVVALDSAG